MNISQIKWTDTLSVRQQVLWPYKPLMSLKVDGDENATHYGAFVDGSLVCVASIYILDNVARLRKFATLPDYQERGISQNLSKTHQ